MTLLEVTFRYGRPPGEREIGALDDVREVYGIWRIFLDEEHHYITVEFDASRLGADDIAALLRSAGFDLRQKLRAAA